MDTPRRKGPAMTKAETGVKQAKGHQGELAPTRNEGHVLRHSLQEEPTLSVP